MEIRSSIRINRPVEEVFDYIKHPENHSSFHEGVQSTEWIGGSEVKKGVRFAEVNKYLGMDIAGYKEIIEFEENTHIVLKFVSNELSILETIDLVQSGSGTRVDYIMEFEGNDFFNAATPLLKDELKQMANDDLKMLKSILEYKEELL